MAAFPVADSTRSLAIPHGDVVEIALLLPSNRAEALVALSRERRQSVAQILRGLIERALAEQS